MGEGQTWKTSELLWKQWDGETLVFHVASGNTHLINPTAVEVLRLLEKEALNAAELSEHLADDKSRQEIVHQIEGLLNKLDHLGLIEPVSK